MERRTQERGEHKEWEEQRLDGAEQKNACLSPARGAEILREGGSVFDLPCQWTRALAKSLGNSAMAELTQGGGEPAAFDFILEEREEGLGVNHISTKPPPMTIPLLPGGGPDSLRPSFAKDLRDRGRQGTQSLFAMAGMEND